MSGVVELRLLGPVELRVASRRVDLGPAKQRTVLAALLVDIGRPVPIDELVERVWGNDAPLAAYSGVYSYVTRLRRVLAGVGSVRLVHESAGYRLDANANATMDLQRFRELVARAGDGTAEVRARAAMLAEAAGLWHGPALADLGGEWVLRTRRLLARQRVDAVVQWAGLRLELGSAAEVVDPLRALLAEHPLVETLAAALIRALCREGRAAEALECYAATRQRLVDELGTEPGAELRRLHEAVLRGDLDEPRPRSTAVVAQLPMEVRGFAGRHSELGRLDAVLAGMHPVCVVWGGPGVGKTTLAVHWARRVAHAFPDGQLFVNLRGFAPDGRAMAPEQALRGFLESLGVAAQHLPSTRDALVGMYRSRLVGKRMLVVLDNAATAEQVRPLLPGSPGSLAVVTSRAQLVGLVAAEGACPLPLDVLPADEARELLVERLGPDRVAAEPRAVSAVVERCARLPLALAVAAARALVRTDMSLAELAEQMRGLEPFALSDDDTNVRAVFSWSYRQLGDTAARLFRLLGLHPGPDLDVAAAASLTGGSVERVRPALAELVGANLLNEHRAGRYGLHDLMRAYATELVGQDGDREAARTRMLDHYVHSAHAADRLLYPQRKPVEPPQPQPAAGAVELADREAAVRWFGTERAVLCAAVDAAAGAGLDRHAWHLARAMATYLDLSGHSTELAQTHHTALAAAQRLAAVDAQAYAHRVLARACARLDRHDEALTHHERALALFGQLGDRTAVVHTTLDLGWLLGRQGRLVEAAGHLRDALRTCRDAGDRSGEALALNAMASCVSRLGDQHGALEHARQALTLFQELGDQLAQADVLDTLGTAHHHLGQYDAAVTHYQRAIDTYRQAGDRYYLAESLRHLGDCRLAAGARDAARDAWRQALAIFDEIAHPDADLVRASLRSVA